MAEIPEHCIIPHPVKLAKGDHIVPRHREEIAQTLVRGAAAMSVPMVASCGYWSASMRV
jgi:hypothetical protein